MTKGYYRLMKAIFILILCIFSCRAYCQQDYAKCHPCLDKCEILNTMLKDSTIEVWYHLKEYPDTPVILIDLKRAFNDCSHNAINGRMTKLVTDSSIINQINKSNILVSFYSSGKRRYKIELYRRINHAYFWTELRMRRGKFFSVKSEGGIID
jgi:regulatory protein YycI of two-component signal transduction system YycFG